MVVDGDAREITVPSGQPTECAFLLAEGAGACARPLELAIERVRQTRQAVMRPCATGRFCFCSPLGVGVDDCETECRLYLVGNGSMTVSRNTIGLIQEIFRMIPPMAETAPAMPDTSRLPAPVQEIAHPPAGPLAKLTDRELEILSLIGAGLSNKEVATHLYISEGTVKTHITHLLRKLGLANRTEAALFALREGLPRPGYTPPASPK